MWFHAKLAKKYIKWYLSTTQRQDNYLVVFLQGLSQAFSRHGSSLCGGNSGKQILIAKTPVL